MAIYITGDTHGDITDPRINFWGGDYMFKDLTEDDILIVLGDWGFDFTEGTRKAYLRMPHRHKVAFIRGNHDNVDILNPLPRIEMFGDVVGDFGNNTYWLLDGHMYTIEGKRFFCFGGAASIDKDYRLALEAEEGKTRCYWWPEEVPSEEDFRRAKETLKANDYTFDYFLTHCCRPELKPTVLNTWKLGFKDLTESMVKVLEVLIQRNNGSYKGHFFGHYHLDVHSGIEHCLYSEIVRITD